jgi:hypothetical protein
MSDQVWYCLSAGSLVVLMCYVMYHRPWSRARIELLEARLQGRHRRRALALLLASGSRALKGKQRPGPRGGGSAIHARGSTHVFISSGQNYLQWAPGLEPVKCWHRSWFERGGRRQEDPTE